VEAAMKKGITFITFTFVSLFIIAIGLVLLGQKPIQNFFHDFFYPATEQALPIPAILKDQNPDPNIGEFQLTAQSSTKEFIKGVKADTYSYNGDYLGPVIRLKRGEKVSINITNSLHNTTTVHWHGLEIPGKMDGGPESGIQPHQQWKALFSINQPAATLWYHPHPMYMTGEQVYKGLAGLIYIDDDVSEKLNIPKEYGKNDFPLIIQDRRFTQDGNMPYKLGVNDLTHGFEGDTYLTNGSIHPYLEVPRGKVRFRILNGSNGGIYHLNLSSSKPFWQIASDGGFFEKPVKLNEIELSPAERAEIIVDFSDQKYVNTILLQDDQDKIMKFIVKNLPAQNAEIPSTLAMVPKIPRSAATRTRTFVFEGAGASVNINGKKMDPNRIDEVVPANTTEIWAVTNASEGITGQLGMPHPFHAHGVQFQILDRDGKAPPENERGWKDTFLVHPGETVRAITTFKNKGTFMYHCHILEHEDAGMMGQYQVK
jgi:blue copper oxidase